MNLEGVGTAFTVIKFLILWADLLSRSVALEFNVLPSVWSAEVSAKGGYLLVF